MVSGVDIDCHLEFLSSLILSQEEENQLILLAGGNDTQVGFSSRIQTPLTLNRNLSRKKFLHRKGNLLTESINN